MMTEDTMKTKGGIRMATEVLLEITNDKEEYARLCDEIIRQFDYQSGMVNANQNGIKEGERIDWEKAREKDHKYFLELLNQDLAKEEIKEHVAR